MEKAKRFIRLPEVINRTGYRRTSIYEKIAEGTFPAPIKLGPRAVAWVSEEIEEWMDARVAERDAV
jgi:prophage regulatory protein